MMACYNKPLSVDEIKALCDRDVMFKRALKCINELQSHSLQIQNDATRDANEMKGVCKCKHIYDHEFIVNLTALLLAACA